MFLLVLKEYSRVAQEEKKKFEEAKNEDRKWQQKSKTLEQKYEELHSKVGEFGSCYPANEERCVSSQRSAEGPFAGKKIKAAVCVREGSRSGKKEASPIVCHSGCVCGFSLHFPRRRRHYREAAYANIYTTQSEVFRQSVPEV